MKRWLLAAAITCLMAGLSACSSDSKLPDPGSTSQLRQINVVSEAAANFGQVAALDVVFVYERSALALLPKTGPDWFSTRDALLSALDRRVAVMSLQVPPGSVMSTPSLPKDARNAIAVYSYANYVSADGQYRGNLTSFKCVLISLFATQISYSHCG